MSEQPIAAIRHDDEIAVDVVRYGRYLWRHKVFIVLVTLACGAIGAAIERFQTPIYTGTARLSVMRAGTTPAYDATTRFQAELESEPVITAALERLRKERPEVTSDVRQVWSRLSSRLGSPPNVVFVEVTWPMDGDVATRLATILSEEALRSSVAGHLKSRAEAQAMLRDEVETLRRRLADARSALEAFDRANPAALAPPPAVSLSTAEDAEHRYLEGEITAERARAAAVERQLAGGELSNELQASLTKQLSESRIRLAGHEAKYVHLERKRALAAAHAAARAKRLMVDQRRTDLIADLTRAEQAMDVVTRREVGTLDSDIGLISMLEVIEVPHVPGRRLGSRIAGVPRGLAVGIVLSVFAVLTYRGFKPR